MHAKKILLAVPILCLAALPLSAQNDEPACYDPTGFWIAAEIDGPPYFNINMTPMGNEGNKWSVNVDGVLKSPMDQGFPGLDENAEYTNFFGVMEKVGPNRFHSKTVGYITGANREPIYYQMVYGDVSFTSCDTMLGDILSTVYLPSQDKNLDGLPDADEEPIARIQTRWRYVRAASMRDETVPDGGVPDMGEVWITDTPGSTLNLAGGVDEDPEDARSLTVHWNVDATDLANCHIYVSADGGPYEYLYHTGDAGTTLFEWKAGAMLYQNPALQGGPRFGHSYAFAVYALTQSGDPRVRGPYKTNGAVMFVKETVPPTSGEDMRAALEGFDQALNAGDYAGMGQYLADDFLFDYVPLTPPADGRDAFLAFMRAMRQNYNDALLQRVRVHASPSQPDVLVLQSLFSATNVEFNAPVQWPALQILEFSNGLMTQCTEYADHLVQLIQLGLAPAPDLSGLTPSFELPEPRPSTKPPLELAKQMFGYWNAQDLENWAAMANPDGQFMNVLGTPLNRAQLIAVLEQYIVSAPDMTHEPIRFIELNDGWVCMEAWMRGTNTGPLFGIPPSGKTIEFRWANLFHFGSNGLCDGFELYWDQVTFMTQNGALPRTGSTPASEAEMQAVMESVAGAINGHDPDRIATHFTEDATYEFVPWLTVYNGHEGGKSFFGGLFENYDPFQGEFLNVLVRGNKLFTDVSLSIGMDGVTAINRVFHIWEFRGDKIFKVTEYLDTAVGLIQWGLLPPLQVPDRVPSFPVPEPDPSGLPPLEAAKEIYGFWRDRHIDKFVGRMHPDGEFMTVMGSPINREQVGGLLEYFINSSPDMINNLIRFTDFGDGWVTAEVEVLGTNLGDLFGIPPTGKPFDFKYMALYHFDESGLLTHFEIMWDKVTQLTQMGVIPPMN